MAAVLLVSACASTTAGDAKRATESPQAQSPSPSPDVFSDTVDIGSGRKVFVNCVGRGSPVVLLESGDESGSQQWRKVQPRLTDHTRTCAYDRLGNGASDEATGCRRMKDLRGDLEAVLRVVGIKGPYVLVGTSGGGYLMAGFAYAHPTETVGMVFVETPRAIQPAAAPAELLAELRCDSPANQERRDYVSVEHEAWDNGHRIGNIPLTVISNDYGQNPSNAEERTNVKDQRGWFVLSPRARQVVVTSGHGVPENEPEVVIEEILRVLEEARAG